MSSSKKLNISQETRTEIDRIMSEGRTITITIQVSQGFGNTPLGWFLPLIDERFKIGEVLTNCQITDSHTPEQLDKRAKLIGKLLGN